MNAILFTATEEHDCAKRSCKRKILVGERAIKSTGSRAFGCGERTLTTLYYHEDCWPPGGRQGRNPGKGGND